MATFFSFLPERFILGFLLPNCPIMEGLTLPFRNTPHTAEWKCHFAEGFRLGFLSRLIF